MKKCSGILLVNKPKGMTSRDVVNEVSRLLKIKKIGHNGTLDPIAEGVLVVCLGKATKLNEILMSKNKEYIAEVMLGIKTDSLDTEGKILSKKEVNVTCDDIKKMIDEFPSSYIQEVPIYSAVKVNGKKLYEYARNGEEVVLPKKEVKINFIELLEFKGDKFTFKCNVSKGTYIRSLISDMLGTIGEIGTMSNLKRIGQGDFKIEDTYSLTDIKNNKFKIMSVSEALKIKKRFVDDELKFKIINGQKLPLVENELILFLDKENRELAIYEPCEKFMKVKVMLYEEA